MSAISIRDVTKIFGSQRAVDRLSLDVPEGSIFGLLGPNGSGKTTTIRMVLKIILPDEGTITVLGRDLDEAGMMRIGFLPEERGLYKGMRVEDHLVFFGELHGLTAAEARHRARKWLERFEVPEWSKRKVQELSKGMQQKVQFIGTLLHDPALVILDEPFSGLDPVNSRLMKDVMLEMRDRGSTVIFSTHQMDQVEKSCDHICLIHKGRLVIEGPLDRIRQEYGTGTVKVEYAGQLPREKIHDLVEKLDDHGRYAEMRLRRAEDAGTLLRRLVDAVEVRRFDTSEASLEEIFISLVEEAR
jgi:ABC-2 type transport system ATP-binding protein